ncbi:MAG: Rossmann-like and DUF2520 domain-containing protein [Flavobacteriales bacterium]
MKISFIGSGHVATHLSQALFHLNHQIVDVFSRSEENAKVLAKKVGAQSKTSLNKLNLNIDAFIICVPDEHIAEISHALPKNVVHIHTSGNTNLNVLRSDKCGVFYPLQTFSKTKEMSFYGVHLLLEANNEMVMTLMQDWGLNLKTQLHFVNSEERKRMHVAAVFACNFSNLMVNFAEDILSEFNLDSKLLLPLIQETTRKLETMSAHSAQTGPAIRRDQKTISDHLNVLNQMEDSNLSDIYTRLTKEIQNKHGEL